MKAAVFHGPGDFRIEDVNDPTLKPDGAIIRVKATGICGSDLHIYNQGGTEQSVRVLGHEFSGEVVDVGANVTDVKPGMRVVVGGSGAYAEYVGIPRVALNWNVLPLPDDMSFEAGALTEPTSVGVNAAKRAEPKADDIVVVMGAGMIGCIAGRLGDALALMRSGQIKTQPLVTHEFSLDDITRAFEMQAKPAEAVKVVIKP